MGPNVPYRCSLSLASEKKGKKLSRLEIWTRERKELCREASWRDITLYSRGLCIHVCVCFSTEKCEWEVRTLSTQPLVTTVIKHGKLHLRILSSPQFKIVFNVISVPLANRPKCLYNPQRSTSASFPTSPYIRKITGTWFCQIVFVMSKQCGTALAALIRLDLGLKMVCKVGEMW